MTKTLLATVLILAAASASGQTIRARVDLEPRFLPVQNERVEPAGQAGSDAAPAAEAPKPRFRSYVGAQRAAAINAQEAERRLAQAQLARQEGMAPLPSELLPGGQPGYRYWKRQEKLRLAVELAQRRWNKTHPTELARR